MGNLLSSHDKDQDDIIIKCDLEKMAKAFFKDYEIIWHDPNVKSQENQQYRGQLENLCKVKTFTEWKEVADYTKAAKTICHVITSGTNGDLLVKEIFSSQNVPKIFTFCRAKELHSTWTQNYEKVLCTETKIEDVISKIQENLHEWQKQTSSLKFDLPAFAPIFNEWDKSQMNHLHLYLKVIPQFKNWKQAKKDLVSLSKRIFSDKKNEKYIADFEKNYNEYDKETILRWYTQQSFLYKVINNCLRIATSDSLQWSRLLLKDLEEAIKGLYHTKSKNFSGLLYRAAYLSQKEWLSLKRNLNKEIEIHGFLSASKEESVALKFMGVDPTQKVFITIIVPKGPISDEQGFAEIDEFSKFPKEKEVLFNVRSRFTILEAENKYSKDSPYHHLVLLYGAQGLRRFITKQNPIQKVLIQDIGNIFCSHCKVPIVEGRAKFIFLSLQEIEKRIYSCQKCLNNETAAPFLCVPTTKNTLTIEIKGCLLKNSNQIRIPFYGYKCSKCGVKNQKRYFACTDCSDPLMKWCEDCFKDSLSCALMGHSMIRESSLFSFWWEKMSKNELNHLKFQKSVMRENNDEVQQARMFAETHEYQKAIEFYKIYIRHNEAKSKKSELALSYNNIGLIFKVQGKYKKALEYYLKSLEIYISVHGEKHPHVATSYNNIGSIYVDQGEYKNALEYHLKSLEINISIHGKNHPHVAISYSNIGFICKNQGEYKKTLEYYLKSLEITKSVHGENHPNVATSYNNIGSILKTQGKDMKALEYYLKSMEIERSVHGEIHPDVATSYINIGSIFEDQGKYNRALGFYLKSLKIRTLIHGKKHPAVATPYTNIGSIYETQGEHKKALEYYLKSLKIYFSVHGENHPDVATSYNNIGLVYEAQGEYKKALEYHFKSLEIRTSIHGKNHPHVATSFHNIGSIYEVQGEYKKALEYCLKSLEIYISVHGENHPHVATSYNNIGLIYKYQGEYKKALEYCLKSLKINISVHGKNHPDVAIFYNNIGSIYEAQGEEKKALEYHFKSLEIRTPIHGKNHPHVATSYNNIGLIYDTQGEYKKALEYSLKSLKIYFSVHGENHPDVAISYNKIGLIYEAQGEFKKALEYYLKSLEICKSVYGQGHLQTAALEGRIRKVNSIAPNSTNK